MRLPHAKLCALAILGGLQGPASSIGRAPQDAAPPSPLFKHVTDCHGGRELLFELADHLAPPRHRMGAVVRVRGEVLYHSPRPGMLKTTETVHRIRVFAGPDTSPTTAVAHSGEHLYAVDVESSNPRAPERPPTELALRRLAFRKGAAPREGELLRAQIVHRAAAPSALVSFLIDRGRVLSLEKSGADEAPWTHCLLELDGGRVLVRTVAVPFGEETIPGLVGVDWVTHDDLLGDKVESLTYSSAPSPGPGVVGGWTITGPMGSSEVATVESFEEDTRARPVDPTAWGIVDDPPVSVVVTPLGQHLLELCVPKHASRTLAVDLGRGWAVLEAPVRSGTGEAIIAALDAEKPGHPVLYAAVSHHHPHYIGALRPFAARGAKIVCPEGVLRYVEHVMGRPRTLQADRLALDSREIEFIGVPAAERWAPPEAPGRLVAVEAAGRSNHTEAFMVFLLPEHRLGFGGDILWIPEGVPPNEIPLNPRTRGLAEILKGAGDLHVDEYLTSWPVSDQARGGKAWRDRVPTAEIPGMR